MTLTAGRRARTTLGCWPEAVIFGVAFVARMIPEIAHGAMTGNYGYDVSVYYAAADSFIHGRMPYRDFLLLHPPGIVLADTPFAWLGTMTSDRTGFAIANICFALLGAVNAVLVTRVARRMGLPRYASLVGGVVYAVWFGSLISEFDARLEPLGCFLLLCGLLAQFASRQHARDASTRGALVFALLAGLAFGATLSVKIWWTVPVLILLAWELLVGRAVRRVGLMLVGIIAAAVLIGGPFLLAAGSKMWTMVVLDQFHRGPNNRDALKPLSYLVIGSASTNRSEATLAAAVVFGAVILTWLAVRAWRTPAARVIVVMLGAQLVLIATEPSWFAFYADFVTVGFSLLVGAASVRREQAAAPLLGRRTAVGRDASPWLGVSVAAVLATLIAWTLPVHELIGKFPAATMTAAARGYRCVMSDAPIALIDMDVLSRDLHNGCANMVDVTGLLYDLDRRDASNHRRDVYRMWNEDMIAYMRSGDAVLFMRSPHSIDLSPDTARTIEQDGLLKSAGGYRLFRVLPGTAQPAPVFGIGIGIG